MLPVLKLHALPIHRRINLDDFLAFTGWSAPMPTWPAMNVALAYYQDNVPRDILTRQVADPSPWLLPRGNAIKLGQLMQAIDFSRPVQRVLAGINRRFKSFRPQGEPNARRPEFNWFADLSAHQTTLALPGGQDVERVYAVRRPVECLKSTVADAFAWTRRTPIEMFREPQTDKYFRGGGCQYFIWEPMRYLERV